MASYKDALRTCLICSDLTITVACFETIRHFAYNEHFIAYNLLKMLLVFRVYYVHDEYFVSRKQRPIMGAMKTELLIVQSVGQSVSHEVRN